MFTYFILNMKRGSLQVTGIYTSPFLDIDELKMALMAWKVSGAFQVCPGLNANEIQIPYDKHHKVSFLVKSHQNTHNSVKYEVI